MDIHIAADMLAQLGKQTRLRVVRFLVRAGHEGLPVGRIQEELDIPASTLTHHLNHLKAAGLLRQTRKKTSLWCRVDFQRLNEVSSFLMEECCSEILEEHREEPVHRVQSISAA